jgi:hypothetical protein
MTVDGGTVRIDRPMPWVGRLLSLPLLAASGYLLWNVGLGLRQDFPASAGSPMISCRCWCSRGWDCSSASPE